MWSDRPWTKIATDLFEFDGQGYLVTVDYFSYFFEIDRLYSTTALSIIRKFKAHMATYGIPNEVISNQGHQFTSEEFKNFCNLYEIKHSMFSPHYHQMAWPKPRSNRRRESPESCQDVWTRSILSYTRP